MNLIHLIPVSKQEPDKRDKKRAKDAEKEGINRYLSILGQTYASNVLKMSTPQSKCELYERV